MHGASPSTQFIVRNTGDSTLIVEKLGSSCGCARAIKWKRAIKPGAAGKIEATVFTKGLQRGNHMKKLYIHSNDPIRPLVELKLVFNVVRFVTIYPSSPVVALNEDRDQADIPIKATNHSDKPIRLFMAKSPSSRDLQERLSPGQVVIPPGGDAELTIIAPVVKASKSRFCSGIARIMTDHPKEKELSVRYFIRLARGKSKK
jgi:hypothetical protein